MRRTKYSNLNQGKQVKLCLVIIAFFFIVYVTITQTSGLIDEVEDEYKQWHEESEIKKALYSKAIKTYNLRKVIQVSKNLSNIIMPKFDDFNATKLSDLPDSSKKMLQFLINNDTKWEIVCDAIYQLLDSNKTGTVNLDNLNKLSIVFSESADHLAKINKVFDKMDFNSNTEVDKQEFSNYMSSVQLALKNILTIAKRELANSINKDALKNGKYFIGLIESGLELHSKQNENEKEQERLKRFNWLIQFNNWNTLTNLIFDILDQNGDDILDQDEIQDTLTLLAFENEEISWFKDELKLMDIDLSDQQYIKITQDEFSTVSLRFQQMYTRLQSP